MSGRIAPQDPRPPLGAPDWAARMCQDIVTWVWHMLRGPQSLTNYTVATLPDAAKNVRTMIYVSDETGGAVPAFSDGTDWRRVTDRTVVS